MFRTLLFFIGYFVPQKNIKYFRAYLDEVGAINRAAQLGADAERRHVASKHWVTIVFLLVHSCHQLWLLFAFPDDLSARQLLLHYDLPAIDLENVMFNAVWASYGPFFAMMYEDYYLRSDDRILALLEDILFRQRCTLFARNRFNGTTPYDFLLRYASVIMKRCHVFVFSLHFVVLYYHFYVIMRAFDRLNVSFEDSPLDLFIYRMNGLKFYAYMYVAAHILVLVVAITGMISLINYVMFKLANQVLLERRRKRVKMPAQKKSTQKSVSRQITTDWRRFHRFRRYFIESLRYFSYANDWTGKSFAPFLVVNFPLNAYLIIFLLVSDLPKSKKFPPTLLIIGQLITVFGLHLVFSMFNSLIHRPCKPLIGLMARQHSRSNQCRGKRRGPVRDYIRDQIKLSHFIGAFHSNNRYGRTYGKCGLITMATFAKCLMFYGKFLMISYKNIRQIK